MKNLLPAIVVCSLLAGCMNMPTQSSQITGTYQSTLKYESFDLTKLKVELDSLTRREAQLTLAQDQRYKTSQTQAFWWGFGQGDGIEASELAAVRGELEAVKKAIAQKETEGAVKQSKQQPEKATPNPDK